MRITAVGFAGPAIAFAAIVIGLQARSFLGGARGHDLATVAVAIAAFALLSVFFFLAVGPPD